MGSCSLPGPVGAGQEVGRNSARRSLEAVGVIGDWAGVQRPVLRVGGAARCLQAVNLAVLEIWRP